MDDASAEPKNRQRKQYYSVGDAVWGNRKCKGNTKLVALRLAKNWPRIFPSIGFLCEETGLSERTVQKAIAFLEREEIISVTRRPGTSSWYEFPRVSIPDLGRDPFEGGGGGQNLRPPSPPQNLPTTPAGSAHPPPQILPPNSRDLTLEPKGRGNARGKPRPPTPLRLVFHTSLDGWEMSDELRAEALALGITPKALDFRLRRLRLARIGGRFGTSDRDGYVRTCIEEWAGWEAEKAGNAQRGAGNGSSSSPRPRGDTWTPTAQMKRFAAAKGIDLDSMAEDYVRSGTAERLGNGTCADDAFVRKLVAAARAKQKAAA